MRFDRFQQELEHRSALLRARGDGGPDPLAPAAPGFATRALRNPTINHHEANRLLRQIVRRLDARRGDEPKVGIAVLVEPFGQILRVLALRNASGRHAKDFRSGRFQLFGKSGLAELLAPVDHGEQFPQRLADPLAVGLLLLVRQRGKELGKNKFSFPALGC